MREGGGEGGGSLPITTIPWFTTYHQCSELSNNFFSSSPCWTATRIGLFAQGQILCISPNGLQPGHCDAPPPPFWMTENEFWSHFSPFQRNTQLWFFFHKMAAGGHFGWPIAFLVISDQYSILYFCHFGWPKITFDRISHHFRSIRNFFFHKMAASGHFGWLKITFDRISRHFRSMSNFLFFYRKSLFFSKWPPVAILEVRFGPFWMTENHFQSHFSPFQNNTQLFFSKWPFWKSDLRQRQ